MAISRLKLWLRRILFALGLVFIALQFVTVERTNPPIGSALEAPDDVMQLLRAACYDCHSHETDWPWYSYVAPISWWVVDHVEHARGDLNFSEWPASDFRELEHALDEIHEQITKGEMPLRSYTWVHSRARLDEEQRASILRWASEGR